MRASGPVQRACWAALPAPASRESTARASSLGCGPGMRVVKEQLGLIPTIDPAELVFARSQRIPFEVGAQERGDHLVPAFVVRGIEELSGFADSSSDLDETTRLFTNLPDHSRFRRLTWMSSAPWQRETACTPYGGPHCGNATISSRDDNVRRRALGAGDPRRSSSEDNPARLGSLHSSAQRPVERRRRRGLVSRLSVNAARSNRLLEGNARK